MINSALHGWFCVPLRSEYPGIELLFQKPKIRRERSCLAVVWTTWAYDDKCSIWFSMCERVLSAQSGDFYRVVANWQSDRCKTVIFYSLTTNDQHKGIIASLGSVTNMRYEECHRKNKFEKKLLILPAPSSHLTAWSENCTRQGMGIYISKNFALHLLYTVYIHVMVLAENLFCVY